MSLWVKCMYVYGVWMCVREFWSVHAFYGAFVPCLYVALSDAMITFTLYSQAGLAAVAVTVQEAPPNASQFYTTT